MPLIGTTFTPEVLRTFFLENTHQGGSLIKVPRCANRIYKAQLIVGKEDTYEVGWESDEEVILHNSLVTIYETNPESEKDNSGSNNTPNPLVRLETIQILIALVAGKGWKMHHLEVKTNFLNGDRKKLDSTLKEMGFQQCVHEKVVYRKVSNGEFIIVLVYGDDLFVTGTSLDCINEFKRRMASQFEMSDLGELTYYLDLTYSVSVVSRYMQRPRISHDRAIKQILRYLKGITSFGIKYKRGNDMRLVGYSSHNVDIDDGRSTTRHVFYFGTSPITWCSQKQTTVVLPSCEAKFVAATATACQVIWLRNLLAEVMENDQVIVEHVYEENERADALTKGLARIRFKEMRSLLGVQERVPSVIGKRLPSWSASPTQPILLVLRVLE
ncbi:uncharacterized mitochondrial protein-like protein [Tanacetum coccineum]